MSDAAPIDVGIAGAAPAFSAVTVVPLGDDSEIRIPSEASSLDGFRQWLLSENAPERGRFTYVAGELIADMSPESYEKHNGIKVEITAVLHQLARAHKLGRVFGDGVLVSNAGAGVSTEPDASFANFDSLRAGRCQLVRSTRPGVAEELLGKPDWVLEIVSRTSIRKDTILLREAYHRAGVEEYWLVDVLGDKIDFRILLRGEASYSEATNTDGWIASPTFGQQFRLTREMSEDDLWQYTLEVQ